MSRISAIMFAKRVRESKGANKDGGLQKSKRTKPEKGLHE